MGRNENSRINEVQQQLTRRALLRRGSMGLGAAALASLINPGQTGSAAPKTVDSSGGLPGVPHFAAHAKRVIYLFMSGAPSQMDMFDYKPELADFFQKDLNKIEGVRMGQRITTMTSGQSTLPIAPSIYRFQQHGQSGAWISELLPHTAKMADDLAIVRSVHTDAINHDPAITFIQTGSQLPGRPSIGAWVSYGLGSMNHSLPTFVVLQATWTGRKEAQALFSRLWGSGFVPTQHQGVSLRSAGDPVLYLTNPAGVRAETRRRMLDGLAQLNQQQFEAIGDPETLTRIKQYEMAFQMQSSVPELTDLSSESPATLEMYGPDVTKPGTFAASCLLARRMAERGVRFVQIFHRGWDQHANLPKDLPNQCRDIDQPSYALIQDLKQRGLLEDTLVVWGGEFGRTVYCQGKLTKDNYGRDHHPRCFTVWMAGGGIKPGVVYGKTDDFSYNIVENPVHIRDMNATILNRLGIDHQRLTFRHSGLDMRLTGVEPASPIREILL